MHFLEYNNTNVRVTQELFEENVVLKTLDKIMSTQSTYDFIKSIEIFFAELFKAERCNVVMVHRFKKFLFRIERDPKGQTAEKLVMYELQNGLAGFVTVAGHVVFTESAQNDNRFVQQIDDPLGTENCPAEQIISCPVFARDDFLMMNKEGFTNYPRAIIQLINKKITLPEKDHEDKPLNKEVTDLLR